MATYTCDECWKDTKNVLIVPRWCQYQQLSNKQLVSVMSAGGHVAPREAVYTPMSYRSARDDQTYKSVISPRPNDASRINSVVISNNLDVGSSSFLPTLKAKNQPPAKVNNVTPINSSSASSSPQYRSKNEDWTYSKGNTVNKSGCRSYGSILQNCRQQGVLYHDQDFEANDTSIYFSRLPPCQFEWKRCPVSFLYIFSYKTIVLDDS